MHRETLTSRTITEKQSREEETGTKRQGLSIHGNAPLYFQACLFRQDFFLRLALGDFTGFSSGTRLASWAGLVLTVNQSADHLLMGSIIWPGSGRSGGSVSRSFARQSESGHHGFLCSSPGKSGRSGSARRSLPWHARSSRSSGIWW
ncbi:MAG: IS110 family transposase [Methanoculleus bourgensis]|nr:IS110 family transposase [Methanoculleus bourgensis]